MGLIDDEDGMDRNDFKTIEGSVNTLPLQSSDGLNLPSSAVDIPDIPQGRVQLVLTTDEINDIIDEFDIGAIVLLNEIFKRLVMPDIVNDEIYNNFIEKVQNTSFSYILENTIDYNRAINNYLNNVFTPDELKEDMVNKEVINAIYGDGTYEYIDGLYESEPDIINNNTVKQLLDKYMETIPRKEIMSEEVEMTKKEKKTGRRARNRKNKNDDVEDMEEVEDIMKELREQIKLSQGKDDIPTEDIPIERRRKRGAPIKTDLPQEQLTRNTNSRVSMQVDRIITRMEQRNDEYDKLAERALLKAGDDINEFNRIYAEDVEKWEAELLSNTFG